MLRTPERLNRDAPKQAVESFLERVIPAVESPAEMMELRRGIALWNSSGGEALYLPEDRPEHVAQNATEFKKAFCSFLIASRYQSTSTYEAQHDCYKFCLRAFNIQATCVWPTTKLQIFQNNAKVYESGPEPWDLICP